MTSKKLWIAAAMLAAVMPAGLPALYPQDAEKEKSPEEKRPESVESAKSINALEFLLEEIYEKAKEHEKAIEEARALSEPSQETIEEHVKALRALKERLAEVRRQIGKVTPELKRDTLAFEDLSKGLPERTSNEQKWNGMFRTNPAIGDVNNDGLLDIAAVARLGPHGVSVWLNDGKGGWTDSSKGLPKGAAGGGVKFADINKDGNLDLCGGIHGGGVRCWFGDGKGNWAEKSNGLVGNNITKDAMDVAVADFNEDGHLDFVFAGWHNETGLRIFQGDSRGNWKEMKTTGLIKKKLVASAIIATDVNNDGHADIAASTGGPWWEYGRKGDPVWMGDGKGNFKNASIGIRQDGSGVDWGVAAGDVNGDGNIDLAFASGGTFGTNAPGLQLYFGNGNGIWKPIEKGFDIGFCTGVGFGDLNGDGKVDLVAAESGGMIAIFRGDGKGNFEKIESSGVNPPPVPAWGLTIGDIDKDGLDDIIVGYGTKERKIDIWGQAVPMQGKVNGGAWVKVWCPRPADWSLKNRAGEIAEDIETLLESK
jgi:hypothetical protein